MAKKKEQGHEAAPPADPFLMTPAEFDEALEANTVDGDSGATETPAEKKPDDTGPSEPEAPPAENPDDGIIDLNPPTGTPPGKPPATGTPEPPAAEDVFEIKHNGIVHRVTRDKLIALAQKGFDYERKVGPHQRIVQLVESDPQAAALLDSYVRGEIVPGSPAATGAPAPAARPSAPGTPAAQPAAPQTPPPRLKPLSDYNSETEWLQDNLQIALAAMQPAPAAAPAAAPAGPAAPAASVAPVAAAPAEPPGSDIYNILAARDPDAVHIVVPELDVYARRYLTAEQYALVNGGDIPALIRFYDQVRPRILRDKGIALAPASDAPPAGGAPPADAGTPPAPKGNPRFRVKPGGGTPPREESGELSHAWEKNDAEFQRILARAKGYE